MTAAYNDPNVLRSCESKSLKPHILSAKKHVSAIVLNLSRFVKAAQELEFILTRVNVYLESKRQVFPRFYFLSNDEMLEILYQTKDPTRIQVTLSCDVMFMLQPHLHKCFEGISTLQFDVCMPCV